MARRRKRTGERGVSSQEPKPEFVYESYRRSDGATGGRLVMLPNTYESSTPDIERTTYRGAEPLGEDAWQRIERAFGTVAGTDPTLRDEVREAVLSYGVSCAQAAKEPAIRWSHVRDTLASIEKAARRLAVSLAKQATDDLRDSNDRQAVHSLLISSANRSLRAAASESIVQHMIRIAATVMPAMEFDSPLSDGGGVRFLHRLE